MAVAVRLKSDVLAGVAPLVGASLAELMRIVVVIEEDPVVEVVKVLEVLLAVHEDLHGLTALLEVGHQQDGASWNEDHEEHRAECQERVAQGPEPLHRGHRLEAILGVEVLLNVDGRIVDATNDPRRTVHGAHDGVAEAPESVGAAEVSVRAHRLLARLGVVILDRSDQGARHRTTSRQPRKRPQCTSPQEARHSSLQRFPGRAE
mmetsp:Transcript_12147/g.26965  ORF Transcript_12147/g.26965 Transcript_12147/m.26965 type:complete len:205 (+) Transcript_12147:133-747(+)